MSTPTTETSLALASVDFEVHTRGSWTWSESELNCLKSAHSRARDLLKVLGGPRAGAGSWLWLVVETSTLTEQKPKVNIFSYVLFCFFIVSSFQKINIFLLFYFYFLIFVFVGFFLAFGAFLFGCFLFFMFLLFVFVFIIFLGF